MSSPPESQRSKVMTLLTVEELELLQAAWFDGHRWIMPDTTPDVAGRMERAKLIERDAGQWRLRPLAFQARQFGRRERPDHVR